MAVDDFARGLMTLERSTESVTERLADFELSVDEIALLDAARVEDVQSDSFMFAKSANLRAVDYVRMHQAALSSGTKSAFGAFVTKRYAKAYSGALVDSGCIKSCKVGEILGV